MKKILVVMIGALLSLNCFAMVDGATGISDLTGSTCNVTCQTMRSIEEAEKNGVKVEYNPNRNRSWDMKLDGVDYKCVSLYGNDISCNKK